MSVILGIETSCDDTAAAVLIEGRLASSVVSSQLEHEEYGGVVPEIASRSHQRNIVPVVDLALERAGVDLRRLAGIAVTYGPGLAGSLLVGLSYAKGLAAARGIPLVGVNHLEGHLYSVFVEEPHPTFPFLCLVVSGGHTMLVVVEDDFKHNVLGSTRDDAAGEAFDKVAQMLGLRYPGGPEIDRLAATGDPNFHGFPRSRLEGFDFSFSGIKTSVLYYLNQLDEDARTRLLDNHLADICAAFQEALVDMLIEPLERALSTFAISNVAITGGVSANSALRRESAALCQRENASLFLPDIKYCMDNAAMIAAAGYRKMLRGVDAPLTLTVEPNAALI